MKNKHWIMLFRAVFIFCLVLVLVPFNRDAADKAQVKSGDTVIVVDLHEQQEFTLEAPGGGYNTVTVKDGKIAVTEADCPDQYCVKQGFCNSGEQIVCLPHKLVISFIGESEIDGAVG